MFFQIPVFNFLDADKIKVTIPPTRHDVLHPVDIYEDVSQKSIYIKQHNTTPEYIVLISNIFMFRLLLPMVIIT